MRIKVSKFYQDVSGNKVSAGEYEASELKNDLANYLVKHGHAVVIEAQKPIAVAKPSNRRKKKTS